MFISAAKLVVLWYCRCLNLKSKNKRSELRRGWELGHMAWRGWMEMWLWGPGRGYHVLAHAPYMRMCLMRLLSDCAVSLRIIQPRQVLESDEDKEEKNKQNKQAELDRLILESDAFWNVKRQVCFFVLMVCTRTRVGIKELLMMCCSSHGWVRKLTLQTLLPPYSLRTLLSKPHWPYYPLWGMKGL